ncbi:hypothetical protein [Pararhodonellum marinum]|uniref:hypothetical protein n=1 Tax=Pararhodonellum marinum TaxID=2755358 RepID=UPI00188EE193|nr:hypothetical protein [Pararhodonellum marinum]
MKKKQLHENSEEELNAQRKTLSAIMWIIGILILIYLVYLLYVISKREWTNTHLGGVISILMLGAILFINALRVGQIKSELKKRKQQ